MPPLPAPTTRVLRRAPRGGITLAGRFFRGGQFLPKPKPAAGHALAFDLTTTDGTIAVTNPRTGGTRVFRVATLADGALAGRRVASVRDDARREWVGFGFVDGFGLTPWRRFRDDRTITGSGGYVAILGESARFMARGLQYHITPLSTRG